MKMRYPSESGRNRETSKTASRDPEIAATLIYRSFKEDCVMLQRCYLGCKVVDNLEDAITMGRIHLKD
ncbi:hypothetical protein ACOSP7_017632 [Xanthoceras sorbifolium]